MTMNECREPAGEKRSATGYLAAPFLFMRRVARGLWRRRPAFRYEFFMAEARNTPPVELPEGMAIVLRDSMESLSPGEKEQLYGFVGRRAVDHKFRHRFKEGMRFYLLKQDEALLCYVWCISGYSYDGFTPMADSDVYMLDGGCLVAQRYKGRFYHLMMGVRHLLGEQGAGHCLFATHARNKSMIRCAEKIHFSHRGSVFHCKIFGRDLNLWRLDKRRPKV